MNAATDSLQTYINEGRLIRKEWGGTDAQGRETACLLAAMVPKVRKTHEPKDCPADIMPEWMAHLTPWIDDAGTVEHWPAVVARYADLASRWHVLTAADWELLERRVKIACIRAALESVTVDEWGVRSACELMCLALEDGSREKIAVAHAAAYAAAYAAANAATHAAAHAAAYAAANAATHAAAYAAAYAATHAAARAAAYAAAHAAYAAAHAAADAAADAARAAADAADAAADKLIDTILGLIESALLAKVKV